MIKSVLDRVGEVVLYKANGESCLNLKDCLSHIHNAQSDADLLPTNPYIRQLAFAELLANQIALKIIRDRTIKDTTKTDLKNKSGLLKQEFLQKLPFELTNDQKKAISEIETDIYSSKRMLRLLQGDVGSGKTVVALLTLLPFLENQRQVAIMCPTSILAKQHYEYLVKMGINAELLTGAIKGKKKILTRLANGEIDVAIGTHALFQDGVNFKDLGYVIIDEQHRFGVVQRLSLIEKGANVDTLIMSATPIPRTLSLSIYGDMDLSTIYEKPKNRKEIITTSLHKDRSDTLFSRIRERVGQGEKVYWVCPLINESETEGMEHIIDVNKRFEVLESQFGKQVALLHGEMKEEEKNKILSDFAFGDKKILVSTTVIEVGIDVPDATIIVIENPERFGLAQIHQLRGRVGRGNKQSYCLLFYNRMGENFKKRAEILKNTSNGFVIAEEDLKLRGAGEILGVRQSGFGDMNFAVLEEHYDLLLEATKTVKYVSEYDNLLRLFGYDEMLKGEFLN
jgi:ATP-dependent DNA helicase RecG